MASYFAAQLKDMFFVLVERVTGYGWSEGQDDAGAQEPTTKLTSAEVSPTEEEVTVVQNIQIRARSADPIVSSGTKPQVN